MACPPVLRALHELYHGGGWLIRSTEGVDGNIHINGLISNPVMTTKVAVNRRLFDVLSLLIGADTHRPRAAPDTRSAPRSDVKPSSGFCARAG